MMETDEQGSFGGVLEEARLAATSGGAAQRAVRAERAERDAVPDHAGQCDSGASEAVLARYLDLAMLADQQLPRLGFFPAGPSAVGHVSGRESSAVGNVSGRESSADGHVSGQGSSAVGHVSGRGSSGLNAAVAGIPAYAADRIVADPVAWFTANRIGLLETTRWACGHGRYLAGARLASRQVTCQYLRHRLDDADQIWRAVEQAAEQAGDIATSSEARFHLAWVMADSGRFADAYAALDRCIPILEARGVRGTLAVALYWRAFCADALGWHERQRSDCERCLGLARQLREPGTEVTALRLLGLSLMRLGSQDRGVALCEQAVILAREWGEPAWEYYAISSLAHGCSLVGRYECSERWCHQGIEASRRLGLFVSGEAYMLGMLGDAYTGQGRCLEAAEAYSRAMAEFERTGDRRGQALCLLKLGRARIALGEPQRATQLPETTA